MKISADKREVADAITELELSEHFDIKDLQFEIRTYEKKELISSPLRPLTGFVFILSGSVRLYHINDANAVFFITNIEPKSFMGYNEFAFGENGGTLYSEAVNRVRALILPFRQPKRALRSDSRFLMFVLQSHIRGQIRHTELNRFHANLEDKLLFYMKNICEHGTIENVNSAVTAMGCSRRQLQRVFKKLCSEDVVKHEKRGRYILNSPRTDMTGALAEPLS